MKVAFFTEGGYKGKIPRDHPNMKVDLAWVCCLNADHYNRNDTPDQYYDLGIYTIPTTNRIF